MATSYWRYESGANRAEPITAAAARGLAWKGCEGPIVVEADDEATAYRMANQWDGQDEQDDIGDLGLDWRQLNGHAVLIEY